MMAMTSRFGAAEAASVILRRTDAVQVSLGGLRKHLCSMR